MSSSPSHQGFSGGSAVKTPSAVQETWVRSLGQEDPLEKEMATLSHIFHGLKVLKSSRVSYHYGIMLEIPWTKKADGLIVHGSQRVRHYLVTKQQQQ